MQKSFKVYGQVQGVMFRQTFIRGLIKRGLQGGATNQKDNDKTVHITIEADSEELINKVIIDLIEIKIINSWKATIEKIDEIELIDFDMHEVTTGNVDEHKWSSGVEFYF